MNDVLKILLETTLYSSALILSVIIIKAAFQSKISRRMISALWLIVLLRLAMPVTIDSPVHLDKLFMKEQPAAAGIADTRQQEQTGTTTDINPNNLFEIRPSLDSVEANDVPEQAIANETPELFVRVKNLLNRINLYSLAFFVWLGGMLTILFINGLNIVAFSRKIRKCVDLDDIHVRLAFRSAQTTFRIRRKIGIAESIHINVPMVYGLLRHKIILPVNLKNSISTKKLKLIIMHELCHIRRMDTAVNSLWLLAKAIHWFNPLVWVAYRIHLTDMELACDEMVADHLNDLGRLNYSQGLIDIVRLSNNAGHTLTHLSFCNNSKKLKERIKNLITPVKKMKVVSLTATILTLIMIVGCFTTACQPTPENLMDDNKGDRELEGSMIQTTVLETVVPQETGELGTKITETGTNSVTLTIDEGLQRLAEETLQQLMYNYNKESYDLVVRDKGVAPTKFTEIYAAIVMQVQSGEILAIASYPSFDPNIYNIHESSIESHR